MAAKVAGELPRSFDPTVSEWGNPLFMRTPAKRGGERPELKHLNKGRKINHRDSVSKRRANAEQPKPKSQDLGVAGQAEGLTDGNQIAWKGKPQSVIAA